MTKFCLTDIAAFVRLLILVLPILAPIVVDVTTLSAQDAAGPSRYQVTDMPSVDSMLPTAKSALEENQPALGAIRFPESILEADASALIMPEGELPEFNQGPAMQLPSPTTEASGEDNGEDSVPAPPEASVQSTEVDQVGPSTKSSPASTPKRSADEPKSIAQAVAQAVGETRQVAFQDTAGPTADVVSLQARIAELDQQVTALQMRPTYRVTRGNNNTLTPNHRLFATFESVLVQPTQSNTTGLIIETPSGYSHVMFPWKILHSPRVSFGYDPGDDTLGWRVRFWQFRHNENFEANASNGLLPIGYEGTVGYLSEDGDITTGLAFIEEGFFHSHVRTDVVDWELQRRLSKPVNIYAGLRYAKIKQGYRAMTDRGNLWAASQFRGIGPTLAVVLEHELPLDRLTLFTVARGSMLFGQKRFRVIDDVNNMSQTLGGIDIRSGDDGADSMATNAELQLGIRYEVASWLMFSVAVEAQHYADIAGANPSAVFAGPDSGLAGDSPLDDHLSLIGLNVATTFVY